MPAGGDDSAARQITFHEVDDVRAFTVSPDGATLVYALWDRVLRADAPAFAPRPLAIAAAEDLQLGATIRETRTSGADEIAPAPSDDEVAISVRGELFVVPTKENRPTLAVSPSPFRDRMPAWSPAGGALYFVSDREDGVEQIYKAEPVYPADSEKKKKEEPKAEGEDAPASDAPPAETSAPAGDSIAPAAPMEGDPATMPAAPSSPSDDATTSPTATLAPEAPKADAESAAKTPSTPQELKAEIELAKKRLEKLGDRMAELEIDANSARARLSGLETSRDNAPEIQALPAYQDLWNRWLALVMERQKLSGDPAKADALEEVNAQVVMIEMLIAKQVDGRIASERAAAESLERQRADLRKGFDEAGTSLGELESKLAKAEADAASGKGGDKKDADADKDEFKLEDRPFWQAIDFKVERLTRSGVSEFRPTPSPDGTKLAFERGRGDIVSLDLETGEEKTILTGWTLGNFAWSPDGKWIAFDREDFEYNSDVWIVASDGAGEPVNISNHPDDDFLPRWSGDGKILAWSSRRYGFDMELCLTFLDKNLEEFTALELTEYFEKAGDAHKERVKKQDEEAKAARERRERAAKGLPPKAAKDEKKKDDEKKEDEKEEPAERLDFAKAGDRVRRVTSLDGDQIYFALSVDGQTLLFGNSENYASIKWDGSEFKSLPASGDAGTFAPSRDGKRVYHLARGGRPGSLNAEGGDAKSYEMSAKLVVDLAAERAQKFDDAARTMGRIFYHPEMKGLDWAGLSAKYRALALKTRLSGDFNAVFALLLGELNASHTGLWGGYAAEVANDPVGRLGLAFDPAFSGPGLRVASVTKDGPADREASKIAPGETILSVNGAKLDAGSNYHALLVGTAGERVALTVAAAGDGSTTRSLVVVPQSGGALDRLEYEALMERRRALVSEWSGGRLAYAHIRSMSLPEVHRFERELYAVAHGKEGLVVDVRDNGGGWTADWLLQIFFAPEHAATRSRGGDKLGYPQGRRLLYAWSKPAALLCNENSFSNAEIFSHAWKTLKRGKLIGMPTFGGVISTGSTRLIDGASLRTPGRGWYLPDGTDMENNGAVPDILVPHTPANALSGEDAQLRRAVEELLKELDAPAAAASPAP
jgi:C-terminal processing protease CtpA/Prc